VPLLTPVLFALVIAPALKTALHTSASYEAYVAIGTVGLLVPLNTFFLGLDVIIDRESGAQRELLAAPVPRGLLVLGNLVVALAITALQIGTLIGFAVARRIHFDVHGLRMFWFVGAALLLTVAIYGAAETLAARMLHAIWRMGDATDMAALSVVLLGLFAFALTRVAVRAFTRSATS
jgi:ABC-2 type transport system permease protein